MEFRRRLNKTVDVTAHVRERLVSAASYPSVVDVSEHSSHEAGENDAS